MGKHCSQLEGMRIYMHVCVYEFMCMFYICIFMYGWMDTQRKRNAE